MSLREKNKAEKLARITAAARALFAEQGFAETTTRQIADRAGVAAGTVFLYVSSKEELLFLVWRDDISVVVERAFATLPGTGLLDELMHLFHAFGAFYMQDPALSRIYVRENLFVGGELGERNRAFTNAFLARLGERVGEAIARGELSPGIDVLSACFGFFSAYLLALIALLMGELDLDAFAYVLRATLHQQIHGMIGGKS